MIKIDWQKFMYGHVWFGWAWIHVDREAIGIDAPMDWYRLGVEDTYWKIIRLDKECREKLDHTYINVND